MLAHRSGILAPPLYHNWRCDITISLKNWLRADDGTAISGATVEAFVSGTAGTPTTAATATTSTEAVEGRWAIESLDASLMYDVKLTSGAQVRWQKGAASPNFFAIAVTDVVQVGNGAVGRPSFTFLNDPDSGFYRIGANNIGAAVNGAKVLDIGTAGLDVTGRLSATTLVYVNETSDADVTIGVVINQGANENDVVGLKATAVAHGMTALRETDTFGWLGQAQGSNGGLMIGGAVGSTGYAGQAIMLSAALGMAADTTKSTAAVGVIQANAYVKSGTGITAVGANGNLLVVTSNLTTRFILDSDGDSHQDVGTAWTQFHGHDDVALLNTLSAHLMRQDDPIREQFGRWLQESREPLERLKLVTFNENGHHFVNWSRMHMLVIGAVQQIAERLQLAEARLALLPSAN